MLPFPMCTRHPVLQEGSGESHDTPVVSQSTYSQTGDLSPHASTTQGASLCWQKTALLLSVSVCVCGGGGLCFALGSNSGSASVTMDKLLAFSSP